MNGWVEWMNEWMNGWVNENDLLKGVRLRTLENKKNVKKTLEMFGFNSKYQTDDPKDKFWHLW